ncbi:MAG: hypothetical protein ACXWCG_08895, partial [Flavitalea sp.]
MLFSRHPTLINLSQDPSLPNYPLREEKNKITDDHISFAGIREMFIQLFRMLLRMLDFINTILFRHKWLILGGLLLGLVAGYLYYLSKKNTFKIVMIVEFTELNKRTFAEIFSQLNTLILSGSHEQLATELQIPLPVAKSIGLIETFNINNEPLHKDTSTRVNQPFKVVVGVRNDRISDTLQSAIITYLNNNPYLLRLKNSQKKTQLHKLMFIDS